MDIFGRSSPTDYKHLAKLENVRGAGSASDYLRQQAERFGGKAHNFNALGSMAGHARAESEGQAIGFAMDNLAAVQSVVDEILYRENRLRQLIPLKLDVPEGAQSYIVKVMDYAARGQRIESGGVDAPSASISLRGVATQIYNGGITAEWSLDDMRAAMFAGVGLDQESVRAATRGAMAHLEMTALVGDPADSASKGLCNYSQSASSGTDKVRAETAGSQFGSATGDQMGKELQQAISNLLQDSEDSLAQLRAPLVVYLAPLAHSLLLNTRIGDGMNTAWQYVRENNEWTNMTGQPLQLVRLTELNGAGWANNNGSGTRNNRMVIAINHPDVMEMATPIMPRVTPAGARFSTGFEVQVSVEYKYSMLNVKRPGGIRYIDNI